MNNINIEQIKYLDDVGLKILWEKISNTYLRQKDVVTALTTFGDSAIITEEGKTFIQKFTFDDAVQALQERIQDVEDAQGTNIDNDTIVNKDGILQTDLLLHNDMDNHVLSIVTGKGTSISTWDYTEFYNEAVKDGMLKDVSLVVIPEDETTEASGQAPGTYLKFSFNLEDTIKPIYVDVDDLIDVYEGSTYISITKSGAGSDGESGSVSISLKEAELVAFLKTDEALGIDSIITRMEAVETGVSVLQETIKQIQDAFENLDLEGLHESIQDLTERVESIEEFLLTVPSVPITEQEINELE